ncbi:sulfotransferase family protein [Nitzschia inconspicua]|uniref:Sulfotransferase family protein n=1 Tax=Nitzschia inconspicua TaxID=303405 RepID=A0A9K3LY30_9STRA|nr:sulfotransferase family protein [Nitzschia inconspicua]
MAIANSSSTDRPNGSRRRASHLWYVAFLGVTCGVSSVVVFLHKSFYNPSLLFYDTDIHSHLEEAMSDPVQLVSKHNVIHNNQSSDQQDHRPIMEGVTINETSSERLENKITKVSKLASPTAPSTNASVHTNTSTHPVHPSKGARKGGSKEMHLRYISDNNRTLLTFWSRATISNSDTFIVARIFGRLYDVVPAEFRQCVDEYSYQQETTSVMLLDPCPVAFHNNSSSSSNNNQTSLQKHPFLDENSTFTISIKQTDLNGKSKTQRRPTVETFLAVSYFDKTTNRHIPFLREGKPKQGLPPGSVSIRTCRDDTCPNDCAWKHQQQPSSMFPYFWDEVDHLCKSQNPRVKQRYQTSCNCETTCFTPEAVEDSPQAQIWPRKSVEQRAQYHNDDPNVKLRIDNQRRMGKKMRKFQQEHAFPMPRFDCPSTDEKGETRNKTIPQPIYGSFEHHLMFIPEAKLIFCGVPKAGITEWIKFFRFVAGAQDYLAFPHFKTDRNEFFLGSLTIEKASELLLDPTWTKAVFFRDPAERLLSAYLDKVVNSGFTQKHFKIGITDEYGKKETTTSSKKTLSFEEFVDLVTMPSNFVNGTLQDEPSGHGIHGHTDPHWRPQSMMCGLDFLLPNFDFVGNFNYISQQTKLLLEKVGLWDRYGSKFDAAKDGYSKGRFCSQAILSEGDVDFNSTREVKGFNQDGVSGKQSFTHTRHSKYKLEKYYTPHLMEKVRKAFSMDFEIFDELQERVQLNGFLDVASGHDLQIVKSYCSVNHTISN